MASTNGSGGTRIAAALIFGGTAAPGELIKCLMSIRPWVDGVFIAYNGEGEFPLSDWWCRFLRIKRHEKFEWKDHFAHARDQSFSLVPKDEYDWIFWCDSDDTVEGDPREMLSRIKPDISGVFLRYDYASDHLGNPTVQQWRERFLRTNVTWRWNFPVHEVCHGEPGVRYTRERDVVIKHHRPPAHDPATRVRNRRILVRARREYPKEPRFVHYLANEIFAEAYNQMDEQAPDGFRPMERNELLAQAISLYGEFIKMLPAWSDDAYIANCNMAECYRMLEEYNSAIDADLQGVKMNPEWPNAYVGISRACLQLGDWNKVIMWADMALKYAKPQETTQIFEPMSMNFSPYLLRGIGKEEKRDLEGALEDYETALEAQSDNKIIIDRITLLKERIRSGFVEKRDYLAERNRTRGFKPDKTIAFVTRPLFEPWHPAIEAEFGAGGAETCIMRLAPRFAEDGWRVLVFGTPGDYKGIDADTGVEWWDSNDWDPYEPTTVMVSSRMPEIFDTSFINAKAKYLWMHDVNTGPGLAGRDWGDRIPRINGIVALTNWHASHLSRLYGLDRALFSVIGNGIELSRFDGWQDSVRNENKFIYASSPDRGIDVVLQMWLQIKRMKPEAELHVYYGWTAIDKILEHAPDDHPLALFKWEVERVFESLSFADVHWHDRVPQTALANAEMESGYWLYPTYFMETFCITAIEMMAAGVLPLTANLAALTETVPKADLRISGHPNNIDFQNRYLKRLSEIFSLNPSAHQDLVFENRRFAEQWTWDAAYEKWKGLLAAV